MAASHWKKLKAKNSLPLQKAVLRIRDILVRIWIRTSGEQIRILLFSVSDLQGSKKKFFAFYFLKLQLHHFSKIKSHKEVTKQ